MRQPASANPADAAVRHTRAGACVPAVTPDGVVTSACRDPGACPSAAAMSEIRRPRSLIRRARRRRTTRSGVTRQRRPVRLTFDDRRQDVADVLPSNARLPVGVSKSTQPNTQTSLRLSAGLPFACSGDIYAAVPRIMPIAVIAGLTIVGETVFGTSITCGPVGSLAFGAACGGTAGFARPKSSTLTVPSSRTLMLAGLRSRCTMPCSCAASSASTICRAIARASSTGSGPRAMQSASVGPRPAPGPAHGPGHRPRNHGCRRCWDD